MTGNSGIHSVAERLRDLSQALREADRPDIALMLEDSVEDFADPTRVRPAVHRISEQLRRWREQPDQLPESPKVHHTANMLEDACRAAMKAGVIAAAPPTLAAAAQRKMKIALLTLLTASCCLLVPVLMVEAGVDVTDLGTARTTALLKLPQGQEASQPVSILGYPLWPEATTGARIRPLHACTKPLPDGATCERTTPRLWPQGRLRTYELKLPHQAYGLLFSVADVHLQAGKIGAGRVLLAATDETPEGRYELPLSGSYLGYTQLSCELVLRVQGACPSPRRGEGERHDGRPVPTVLVEVTRGDPSARDGEERLAKAEAEEARRKAERRAAELSALASQVRAALDETDELMRRRKWEVARERIDKLAALFKPLRTVHLGDLAEHLVPADVDEVRARFDAQRAKLSELEERVFDKTFDALTAERNARVPEEQLMERLGRRFGISAAYVEQIYTLRADEMQRRMEARKQRRLARADAEREALERRCGQLPTRAWQAVKQHLEGHASGAAVRLGQCLTPRLSEQHCWEVVCDYERVVEVSVTQPKAVSKHRSTFLLVQGQVKKQRPLSR